MEFKRVTKKESKPIRMFGYNVISDLRKGLCNKYKFAHRLVGSAKWNTILKDKNGWWDIDFQLLLTKNSSEYKENELSHPTIIKNDFFNFLKDKYKDNKNYVVQNSTTAITLINNTSKFSIDFVIIKLLPNNHEIIRRNNKDGSGKNEFTWNELPKNNKAYADFLALSSDKKVKLIEEFILPRKAKEKAKQDNDPTKRSSSEVFIEEVNNYVSTKRNN
ncbi:MAG: hypothetical protein SOU07_00495 [Bacilli bacterium]|nr:hypothetical protein [Acholeplasmataceae bacterium]MDY2901907.1 hypothetical protein [Bacilli bacterium]